MNATQIITLLTTIVKITSEIADILSNDGDLTVEQKEIIDKSIQDTHEKFEELRRKRKLADIPDDGFRGFSGHSNA